MEGKIQKKRKRNRGFTDKMYVYNVFFVAIVVILSFLAMFLSGPLGIMDLSPIGTIVPSAFAELGLHTGFIIWKAKAENARKYKDVNIPDLEDAGGVG